MGRIGDYRAGAPHRQQGAHVVGARAVGLKIGSAMRKACGAAVPSFASISELLQAGTEGTSLFGEFSFFTRY